MIEKGRLEELIEQGATIWTDEYRGSHFKIKLTKHFVAKLGDSFDLYGYGCDYFGIPLNHLYETREEAEWYKEFGCIERTERLVLPTWEEIQKYERFDFKDKYNHSYTLHYISGFKTLAISGWSTEYYAEATKENYTLACRKAKELFLGEKK